MHVHVYILVCLYTDAWIYIYICDEVKCLSPTLCIRLYRQIHPAATKAAALATIRAYYFIDCHCQESPGPPGVLAMAPSQVLSEITSSYGKWFFCAIPRARL